MTPNQTSILLDFKNGKLSPNLPWPSQAESVNIDDLKRLFSIVINKKF
jgi:hypothetical protein